jgi:hypothetical protein
MPQISSKRRSAVLTAFVLPLACLTLVACGSSSTSSTSSNAAAASTSPGGSTTTKSGPQARGQRFTALRECLQKDGITLPKRTPGQPGGGGFLGGGAGPQLPKGITRAQYFAALKKCGGFTTQRFGPGAAGTGQRFSSPAFKKVLSEFTACMHGNGINLPAPNTSGKGPVFNTKGLSTTSTKFKAAQTKCASVLRSAFRAQPGAGGAPPAGGAG